MKWISLKDELPPKGLKVLVYWPPYINISMIDNNLRYVLNGTICFNHISLSGNTCRWDSIASFEKHPPTHWMECPEVPEEYEGVKEGMEDKIKRFNKSLEK